MSFEAVNKELVNNKESINLLDYVKKCNFNGIDLSFIDKFIELVSRNDFCIPHVYLKDYGVYKLSSGSDDLKKKLENNGFKINIDFRLRKVSESAPSGGSTHFNEYMLTPDTFKTLLIRSTKCKTYANYYIYLEKCVKYYNDYQNDLKERYIITLREKLQDKDTIIGQKDDNINQLRSEIKLQHEESQKKIDLQSLEIQKLLSYAKNADARVTNVEDELIDTNTKLEDTILDMSVVQDKLDVVQDKLAIAVVDRAVRPNTGNKMNQVAVLKHNSIYYIACGQKMHIEKTIRIKSNHVLIKKIDNVPNSIYLFDHIKKHFGNKIITNSRNIAILINESKFIDDIESLFDGRLTIDLSKRPE